MDPDDAAAKDALLAHLAASPDDIEALVTLGNLALRNGYRSAACTAYRRAIELDPRDPVTHVNLANALLQGTEYDGARVAYEDALRLNPAFAPAHQGLSFVFSRTGDEPRARHHREVGFKGHALQHLPQRGNAPVRPVVVLVSTAGGDFNTDVLLDARSFDVTKVFVEYAESLPELALTHAVVNAIGDADRCKTALLAAQRLLERSGVVRVLNPPAHILQTGRVAVMERLRNVPGVRVPRIALLPRAQIRDAGFAYPFLVRSPGHHTGRHFVRVESADELDSNIATLPGEQLLVIEFIDVRSADGLVRKYRVLGIGGQVFPAHLAASESWKVHFFTSNAAQSETQRAEDARFLDRPHEVVGERAWDALASVIKALELDYAGVDFGIDSSGDIVIFEANATMSVYPVPSDPLFAYRREPAARIVTAFRNRLKH